MFGSHDDIVCGAASFIISDNRCANLGRVLMNRLPTVAAQPVRMWTAFPA